MKSSIKIDVDYNNQPLIIIENRGHSYYNNQDLRDKMVAKLLDNTYMFNVTTSCVGEDTTGGYSIYELQPVRRDNNVIEVMGIKLIMPYNVSPELIHVLTTKFLSFVGKELVTVLDLASCSSYADGKTGQE